jgi:DUF1365 family protein
MSVATPFAQAASLLFCQARAIVLGFLELCRLLFVPLSLRRPRVDGCTFYEGTVRHTRLAPAKHSFSYPVRYCLIDLDEPPAAYPPYVAHQLAAGKRLDANEARALSGCKGRVRVLLLPASAGFEENPIVVYYCYDADDDQTLRCCLAEVTNTPWGDRVAFPFAPKGDTMPKPMHVSPMQDMASSWTLVATIPDDELRVSVACRHPTLGSFFVATLEAHAVPALVDPEWWGLFMAHRVAIWIYYHALLLIARKGVAFLPHPKGVVGSDYREEVRTKNVAMGWSACPVLGASPERPIVWHDATNFPWA